MHKDFNSISKQLKNIVNEQMREAHKAMQAVPEGAVKDRLHSLLVAAKSGKLDPKDAQRELANIVKDAGKH